MANNLKTKIYFYSQFRFLLDSEIYWIPEIRPKYLVICIIWYHSYLMTMAQVVIFMTNGIYLSTYQIQFSQVSFQGFRVFVRQFQQSSNILSFLL